MTAAEVVHLRGRLMRLTEQLVHEYREWLAAGAVIREVARARDELRLAGVRTGLETAVELMTRQRLEARVGASG